MVSRDEGQAYGFEESKLYSVEASQHIHGHSEVRNAAVAWLIWNAVLRTKPAQ